MKKLGLTAALFVFAAVFVSAQNMFTNGDFASGIGGWENYNESDGKSIVKPNAGKLELAISKIGKVGWACQVYDSEPIPLVKGSTYKISFDASSTIERVVTWRFQLNAPDYRGYAGDNSPITVGPKVQHYEFTFTMNEKTDPASRFCISCGIQKGLKDAPHSVYFDNFKLEKVK